MKGYRDVKVEGTAPLSMREDKMCNVNRKKSSAKVSAGVCVFIILLYLLCSPSSVLGDENLKRYLVETTYDKEVISAFEEIEQMKVLTLSVLGTMQPAEVTSETESWVRLVWQTIDSFNEIQNFSVRKSPEDHIKALSEAYSLRQTIEELEDKAPESAIVLLLRIALGKVLTEEAEYLEDAATHERQTKKRIEYLRESAKAFHESGDISNFARLDYEVKELSARYEADMRIANEKFSNAERLFSEGMQIKTSKPFLPLEPFLKLKESKKLVSHALVIYENHNDEKTKEAYSLLKKAEMAFSDVVVEMIWKLLLYTMILFVIGAYALRSVSKWQGDLTDTRLGNVLIR